MLTWILLGTVCWLAYRQYWLTMALANRNQLISSSAASGATELLDSNGQVISEQPHEGNLPPFVWLVAGALYVVCPLDGDFVPVVGMADDFLVALFAAYKWWMGRRNSQS